MAYLATALFLRSLVLRLMEPLYGLLGFSSVVGCCRGQWRFEPRDDDFILLPFFGANTSYSLWRQLVEMVFVICFLNAPFAFLGSVEAANGLWSSQKTFYKNLFDKLPPNIVLNEGEYELISNTYLEFCHKKV